MTTEDYDDAHAAERLTSSLNAKNYLNLFFYLINTIVTFGIGVMGIIGNGTNSELSKKYQTLVTPNATAFSIWSIIFVSQAVFTIVQLLPQFRAHPMIQKGVGYWYIYACIFQSLWSVAFAFEFIALSTVFIIGILLSLAAIIYSQYRVSSEGSLKEFWLLRFPFTIHCGWIVAATLLNFNVLLVKNEAAASIQLSWAIVSLAALHGLSVILLFGIQREPLYTISAVLSWAIGWISIELASPSGKVQDTFDSDIILGLSHAAKFVSFIILGQILIRVFLSLIKKRFNKDNLSSGASRHRNSTMGDNLLTS